MSTDFRTLRSEGGVLDEHPTLRALAVAAWCGFLGAILALAVIVGAAPHVVGGDWRGLSEAFLGAWALATIPAALAYHLAKVPHGR